VPLVSAILTAYNAEATIAQAIDSALALKNTEIELEIVAVDDGSNDSTAAILASYGGRIKLLRQPNAGVSAARNRAVSESSGKYLAFLDSDDVWLPGRLSKTVAALKADPGAGLAYSDFYEDSLQNRVEVADVRTECDLLERLIPVLPTTVTMRRGLFDDCGGFEEKMRSGQDYLLWLRLARRCRFVRIPEALAVYGSRDGWRYVRRHPPEAMAAFARELEARYERRAAKLTRYLLNECAMSLFARAICELRRGDYGLAARSLLELANYGPSFFLTKSPVNLLAPRNFQRVRQLMRDHAGPPGGSLPEPSGRSAIHEHGAGVRQAPAGGKMPIGSE
jgi:glycosyltransferase involved in cell wall biosynthesis